MTAFCRLLVGDCREVLRTLPAESVHCVVSSPPYWSIRDYGIPPSVWGGGDPACEHAFTTEGITTEGGGNWTQGANGDGQGRYRGDFRAARRERKGPVVERGTCTRCGAWRGTLGLEPTPEMWAEHIVEVMREVRRVLRRDGTVWLNLGDSYYGGRSFAGSSEGTDGVFDRRKGRLGNVAGKSCATTLHRSRDPHPVHPVLKEKDLVGQPWMAAFALRADGWYLRQDNVWAKPNPMPESVRDRSTRAHEFVFLLTKSARYFYDAEAVREPAINAGKMVRLGPKSLSRGQAAGMNVAASGNGTKDVVEVAAGRNLRSVWSIPTFPEAHFATFPPALVEPCIKPGTSERGACPACGAPWRRVVERTEAYAAAAAAARGTCQVRSTIESLGTTRGTSNPGITASYVTNGWGPTCSCPHAEPVPCIVLDPFAGAGTTGLVALRLGRSFVGAEINRQYVEIARRRIERDAPLLNRVEVA